MFANTLYPVTDSFLSNVISEVTEVIKTLRNHPSVIFWCGNNEILQGIREWGWQARHKLTLDRYHELFENVIPKILSEEDPDKSYIPSSPMSNQYAHNEGDVHYWGVWWGGSAVEEYEQRVGLFNSEYGMQSLLPMSSMKVFMNVEEDMQSYTNEVMHYHNKMRGGSEIVERYTKQVFTSDKTPMTWHSE